MQTPKKFKQFPKKLILCQLHSLKFVLLGELFNKAGQEQKFNPKSSFKATQNPKDLKLHNYKRS
jgi:hypothetical protein